MTDLRELAERIVRDKDIRGYITREEEVDLTERILREHHEGLRKLAMRGVEEDGYDTAYALGNAILRALEGGAQADTGEGEATDEPTLGPAAPDPRSGGQSDE